VPEKKATRWQMVARLEARVALRMGEGSPRSRPWPWGACNVPKPAGKVPGGKQGGAPKDDGGGGGLA